MNFEYDIKRYVRNEDYLKGRRFPPYYIKLYKRQIRNNEIILLYKVESERTYKEYDVVVSTSNHELVGHGCTCSRYKEAHSCKHVAAVLINHYNDIIKFTPKDLLKNLSMNIIDSFEEIDNKGNIKEELGLEIEINPSGYQSNVTVKIGKNFSVSIFSYRCGKTYSKENWTTILAIKYKRIGDGNQNSINSHGNKIITTFFEDMGQRNLLREHNEHQRLSTQRSTKAYV